MQFFKKDNVNCTQMYLDIEMYSKIQYLDITTGWLRMCHDEKLS